MKKLSLDGLRLPAGRLPAAVIASALLTGVVTIPVAVTATPAVDGTDALAPLTFTEQQVSRGSSIAVGDCFSCHGSRLVGGGGPEGGPALIGQRFAEKWFASSVMPLFAYIINAMPADNPGALERAQAADVVAYILSRNDFVPGEIELLSDLEALQLMGFEQAGGNPK